MGKHLSEDEIKWILSVESTEAQQKIHELTKSNKDLVKQNKEYFKAQTDLIQQGKKASKEFDNLQQAIDKNNVTIKHNNSLVKELEKTLGITSLTMSQLKRKAGDLQIQLNNTSKALHPEEYAKIEKELTDVRGRMDELKSSSGHVKNSFGNMGESLIKMSTIVKGFIGYKLGEYLTEIAGKGFEMAKELIKEGVEMAETADGVLHAYERLNQPTLLDELRKATKGTVNDLTLMKAAVKADDWNVSFKDLGNYLAFAQLQAEKTGESIDDLMDSLLKGIARQTSKTLINIGISKEQIDSAKKQTGDFMSAINSIIEKRLKEQEDGYISAGDKAEQKMVEVQNAELELGKRILPLKELFDTLWTNIKVGATKVLASFSDVIKDGVVPMSEKLKEQGDRVVELETTLPSLTSRYDELKSKTKLSKDEHAELNSIIGKISTLVPSAITAWDSYGNAIDISTGKVREFMDAEKSRLRFVNREAIEEMKKNVQTYKKSYDDQMKKVKSGGDYPTDWTGTGMQEFVKFTPSEMKLAQEQLQSYGDSLRGAEEELKKLTGQDIDKWVNDQAKAAQATEAAKDRFNKMNRVQLTAWLKDEKNAANQYHIIAQSIFDKKYPTSGGNKDKSDPKAVALKNLETAHDSELNKIRLNGQEKQQTEVVINDAILESDKKYYQDRINMLEGFEKTEKKSAKKAEYGNQIVESKSKILETEVSQEKAKVEAIKKIRTDALQNEVNISKNQEKFFNEQLASKQISQEQYDMLIQSNTVASAQNRLTIEKTYLDDANSLEVKNGQIKVDAVKEANQAVMDADVVAANSRATLQKSLNDLVKDFKSQFKLTTVDEDLQMQMKVLDATYQARREMAVKNNLDTTELDKAYLRAKEQLTQDSEDRINQVREKYGLLTQSQQLNQELIALKKNLDDKLITQKDYEKAIQNLKRDSAKKQFDYYHDLFSNAFTALQQAEMDQVDAKYDVEIAAAKGNSDEVARLENEKEQAKLDVQKKYADANFAIKVSQIIADTAVSIMKAYADLGPVAGTVSAVLLGVTGAAQLVSAKAERDKIKNMTVNSSSSSTSKTGTMTVTGLEKGGTIDVTRSQDGKVYSNATYDPKRRGYVNRPTVIVGESGVEWVASNAALQNPTIAPLLAIMDKHQQAGTIRTLDMGQLIRTNMVGYAAGGIITNKTFPQPQLNTTPSPTNMMDEDLMKRFVIVMEDIAENGIVAPVVLSDLEKKQALKNKSRKIGTKKS